MFAALYVPDFPLQARLRMLPHLLAVRETRPIALLQMPESGGKKDARIAALNEKAREANVETGMTAAQAQARCGDLILLVHSEEDEQTAQDLLSEMAMQHTPDFEETSPGVCTLDLVGADRIWHGREWDLAWELVEELAAEGNDLKVQIGIAANPDLALLIARLAAPVQSAGIDGDESLRRFLHPKPLSALQLPSDMAMVLTLWGIDTIGDFLDLPRQDVAERLGEAGAGLWDVAAGRKTRLLRLVRPPQNFFQSVEFDDGVETLEPLLFSLRRLLETICSRLASAWMAAGEIILKLDFANGETYRRAFRVPEPTCDIELLFRMLHAHLENFSAPAAISQGRLEGVPARPTRSQFHLFESGLRDPNRFTETLASLEGLLGTDRVGLPERTDSHRPDSFRVKGVDETLMEFEKVERNQTDSDSEESSRSQFGLPLRRFRPPLVANVTVSPDSDQPTRIETLANDRDISISGFVENCRGPFLASGDWWKMEANHPEDEKDSRWSRAEWDVELQNQGGIFRLTNVARGKNREDVWWIEGVYG